jgi:hypothetical protein
VRYEELGMILEGIAAGAEWEYGTRTGKWITPSPNDTPIQALKANYAIRLKPTERKMTPGEACQVICELYNQISDDAVSSGIEMPADDLHALALSHHKQTMMIEKLCEMLEASEHTSKAVRAEALAVLKGGKA